MSGRCKRELSRATLGIHVSRWTETTTISCKLVSDSAQNSEVLILPWLAHHDWVDTKKCLSETIEAMFWIGLNIHTH